MGNMSDIEKVYIPTLFPRFEAAVIILKEVPLDVAVPSFFSARVE
jgi:hypothetical protein